MTHSAKALVASVTDVIDAVLDLPAKRVLDVGCGTGALVRWLAGQGAHAVGVETQLPLVEKALAQPPVADERYFHARGEALPFDDGVFDIVIYSYSLHHVPEGAMRDALAECRRVLGEGGVALVIEPVADGDYFAVMRIVDDETRVRQLALEAVRDVAAHGMQPGPERHFRSFRHFDGPEQFFEQIVRVDPARKPLVESRRAQLETLFYRHGKTDEKGYRFEMEIRSNLLFKTMAGAA